MTPTEDSRLMHRPKPKPTRFRLYPRKKPGLYFVAHVWPDRDSMLQHVKRTFPLARPVDGGYEACHIPISRTDIYPDRRRQKQAICGELHFYRAGFNAGMIGHELSHATFEWARRIKMDLVQSLDHEGFVDPSEECFAWSLGYMTAQMAYHAYRLKLWVNEATNAV